MPYLTLTENLKLQISPGLVASYDIQPWNGVDLFWDVLSWELHEWSLYLTRSMYENVVIFKLFCRRRHCHYYIKWHSFVCKYSVTFQISVDSRAERSMGRPTGWVGLGWVEIFLNFQS